MHRSSRVRRSSAASIPDGKTEGVLIGNEEGNKRVRAAALRVLHGRAACSSFDPSDEDSEFARRLAKEEEEGIDTFKFDDVVEMVDEEASHCDEQERVKMAARFVQEAVEQRDPLVVRWSHSSAVAAYRIVNTKLWMRTFNLVVFGYAGLCFFEAPVTWLSSDERWSRGSGMGRLGAAGVDVPGAIPLRWRDIVYRTNPLVNDAVYTQLSWGGYAADAESMHTVRLVEALCVAVLVADVALRMVMSGPGRYFSSRNANVLQFAICVMLACDFVLSLALSDELGCGFLRFARPLRMFPILLANPEVLEVTLAVLKTMPKLKDLLLFILFFLMLASLLSMWFLKDAVPKVGNTCTTTCFADFPHSLMSAFVLITSESFPDLMIAAMKGTPVAGWTGVVALIFILYMTITTVMFMALLLAIIFEFYKGVHAKLIMRRQKRVKVSLRAAFHMLDVDQSGYLSFHEFNALVRRYHAEQEEQHASLSARTKRRFWRALRVMRRAVSRQWRTCCGIYPGRVTLRERMRTNSIVSFKSDSGSGFLVARAASQIQRTHTIIGAGSNPARVHAAPPEEDAGSSSPAARLPEAGRYVLKRTVEPCAAWARTHNAVHKAWRGRPDTCV